jgi:hypothetical protein
VKQTVEQNPLPGIGFLISKNIRPLLGNGSVNTFLRKGLHTGMNVVVFTGCAKEL